MTSDKDINGSSKVERYEWAPTGAPGVHRWIPKQALIIDSDYQREGVNGKMLGLARAWSWPACGSLLVYERADGICAVVDGQNRHGAAMKRDDIDVLPCMVFPSKSLAEEAKAFLEANDNRRPIKGAEKHKAAVLAGDNAALLVEKLLKDVGRTAALHTSSAHTVTCIGRLTKLAAKPVMCAALLRVWPLVAAACANGPLHERVLDGLVMLESRMPEGQSLSDQRWRKKVMALGGDTLSLVAKKAALSFGRGGARVWAYGMLEAINKGTSAHRLVIKGISLE